MSNDEKHRFEEFYNHRKDQCMDQLGRRPSTLQLLALSTEASDVFIKERVIEAFTILTRFKADNILEWPIFYDILHSLLERGELSEIETISKLGQSPMKLMQVMKLYPILAYNPQKKIFTFSNKSIEIATSQFLLIEDGYPS